MTFDYYNWLILPLIIFLSRVCDVTLGTLRHIMMVRGQKNIAPLLGFFEVLIWIVVVSQVMKQANNFVCYIAWAGGFALGNYVGLFIEEKIALGLQIIRIITQHNCEELLRQLQAGNFGTTVIAGQGATGPVKIILTIVNRKKVETVVKLIRQFNPSAFYSIEDIREARKGIFSKSNQSMLRKTFHSHKI